MKIFEASPILLDPNKSRCTECEEPARVIYEIGDKAATFALCLVCLTIMEGQMSKLLENMLEELRLVH